MHGTLRTFAVLLGLGLVVGCKGEEDRSPEAVSPPGANRCVQGIARAVKAGTAKEALAIYYDECADMFSQPVCRDAWRAAAQAPTHLQTPSVADACRKAYCPTYSAFSFDICRDDFTATPETLTKAWPSLFDAILAREAGPAQSQVSTAMLVLYARVKQLEAKEPAAAASADAPPPPTSASAAPSASAATPSPSAAASAPTAARPASSAHAGAVGKEVPAKPKSAAAKAH